MFYVLVSSAERRNEVLARMRADEIYGTFHYLPLHRSPHGERVSARATDCPVTDDISGRLLRLPFFTDLTDADGDGVVASLLAALEATR
jgi:dTDP-4-amino-4,6-dideoxygalactose transaminase